MRVFVLALAILLLPLRGWLGDAMALGMVQQQAPQQRHQSMAAPALDHVAHLHGAPDAHASHASHTTDAPDVVHAAAPSANDCQSTCGNCQLCHSVAIGQPPVVPLLNEAPREAPAFRPAAFASAEPSVGLKPPIS